ncbi:Protein CBG02551 [Caenorhabditis briggsae]|uniref:Protein CBG02551 n=2 Tax=Caenorhabditis briggsae TaxID=6238 RepID=A8WU23_CAEBR|nr:Protein CBG02551 [Caenorhabditis briggsae]ULU06711.1 hypothetical protein L3Y34_018492 [Caenorhabditis briggsae]CAP23985.2 Protein CBG02551 [Caenorhabditis briggsae]
MCEEDGPKSTISFAMVIAGSIISIISISNNVLLFISLIRNNRCFKCYFHFILALCFFDIIISVCYMPVILVDSLKDWTKWIELARAWWPFFVYGLAMTHVCMTTACYILIAVAYERYLITVRSYMLKQFQKRRSWWCFACLAIGVLTKGGMLMELDVFPNEDPTCKNTVMEYYVDVTEITKSNWYGSIYKFWFRNIVTVFLPFFLLLLINLGIVLELRSQMEHAFGNRSRRRFSLRMQSRTNVRQATATMLFICVIYLISNVVNVFITAWEFVDLDSLTNRFLEEYMLSADLSSVLVVTACALRLPIYMLCNPELRKAVKKSFTHKSEHQQKMHQTFSLIAKILV